MSSGAQFMQQRLAEAKTRRARNERCCVVFDLDNTLFDTRARTLHVARQFDAEHGTEHFANLSLDQVGLDGTSTCKRLGTPSGEVAQQFETYWKRAFWDPQNFIHDLPMTSVLDWVRAAHQADVETRFLTGRVVAYADTSLQQLRRVRIDFARREHLHLKPALDVFSIAHKADKLKAFHGEQFVAWYITESRFEIASLQERLVGFPLVLLDFSLERGGPAVAEDTPVLESVF